jgi:galactoside O-acetyltransferase
MRTKHSKLQARYYNETDLRKMGIAQVGSNVSVSEHATIVGLENVYLGSNIRIDSYVVILAKRGQLKIGNNVHIEPNSSIVCHYGVEIGNYCTISHGVRLFTASADYSGIHFTNVFPDAKYQVPKTGKIIVGNHVIIGGNSVVMPNLTIEEGAAIGALSFIRESIPGWKIYGGNPLQVLKERDQEIKYLAGRIENDA